MLQLDIEKHAPTASYHQSHLGYGLNLVVSVLPQVNIDSTCSAFALAGAVIL